MRTLQNDLINHILKLHHHYFVSFLLCYFFSKKVVDKLWLPQENIWVPIYVNPTLVLYFRSLRFRSAPVSLTFTPFYLSINRHIDFSNLYWDLKFIICSQLRDHKTPYKESFLCLSASVMLVLMAELEPNGRNFGNCLASPASRTETFLGTSPATHCSSLLFMRRRNTLRESEASL